MKVSEAIKTRISTRAFLEKPVDVDTIRQILTAASKSPSGGNVQPWHVYVVSGPRLKAFSAEIMEKQKEKRFGEGTEYDIYPPDMPESYKERVSQCGEDLYGTLGISRDDKERRRAQFARNFLFFGAPVALFFAIDRKMGKPQWADLGMFMQNIMLLAREHGLHTCPQEFWAMWYQSVSALINLPPELMLFCGMSVGYMDEDHPVNTLRTARAPLGDFATFINE